MRSEASPGTPASPGAVTLTVLTAILAVCATAACAGPPGGGSARPGSPLSVSAAAAPPVAAGAPLAAVARVVDGDTLLLTGGERVRVLGIDSCEASTPQGAAATVAARDFIGGAAVVLGVEPGVQRDRYGRLLRYVGVPGRGDLGEFMVGFSHTGVYRGRGDAAPSYRARLAARDDGRACG